MSTSPKKVNTETLSVSTSPVVKKAEQTQETFGFPMAIQMIINGEKVTRLEWENSKLYGIRDGGRLRIMLENGLHEWYVTDGDMFSTDWVIVRE